MLSVCTVPLTVDVHITVSTHLHPLTCSVPKEMSLCAQHPMLAVNCSERSSMWLPAVHCIYLLVSYTGLDMEKF